MGRLFKILGKLGCPPKFTRLIHSLYSQAHARLIVDGILTEPFEYNSGVKQGCKLAPTLYGIYAAVLLLLAYENVGHQFSIKIRFRYDGDLFDLRRLKAKTKTFIDFIREQSMLMTSQSSVTQHLDCGLCLQPTTAWQNGWVCL